MAIGERDDAEMAAVVAEVASEPDHVLSFCIAVAELAVVGLRAASGDDWRVRLDAAVRRAEGDRWLRHG